MYAKILITAITLLVIEIGLGVTLVNSPAEGLTRIHALLGGAIGLTSLVAVLVAYRRKVSRRNLTLTALGAVMVGVASVGGRLVDANYDLGLLLMRVGAFGALILFSLSLFWSRKKG